MDQRLRNAESPLLLRYTLCNQLRYLHLILGLMGLLHGSGTVRKMVPWIIVCQYWYSDGYDESD